MLPAGTFGRMDAALSTSETRTDLIRVAVEAELTRREVLFRRCEGEGGGSD